MLVFDELKKNDPQLRLVAMLLAAGLCVLIAGLWWVQVVSSREYQSHLETQSSRTVRIPAARGKILDREGRVLAENQPSYNLSLFLDDLQKNFSDAYNQLHKQAVAAQKQAIAEQEKKLGRSLTKVERKQFAFSTAQLDQLRAQARFAVASYIVAQVGQKLQQPLALDPNNFQRACTNSPYVPYPLVKNATVTDIARFAENFSGDAGAVQLDLQSVRAYPFGTTAAHLIGYVLRDDRSAEGEDAYFDYRLPDYSGKVGIEAGFDSQLHGQAGEESLVINSRGYRQTENILDPPEPGQNVVLTIDLDIQRAAEKSLLEHQGADARAAVVVMDVRSGDVLAMVSSPAINPVYMSNSPAYLNDPKLQPQINRATYGNYAPGSIFKPIVGLAALENGLDPNETYDVQPDPRHLSPSAIKVGTRYIGDTVQPGPYNFQQAIEQSSNSYFIFNGLRTGIEKIVRLAEKFHFGERTGLTTRQESSGIFPTLADVRKPDWYDGRSANIFFGQGEMAVTPIQMAVAYSAIANGGTVLWPRLVERIEPQDPASGETATNFPSGVERDQIGVSERSLKILHEAMLSETEDPKGSGYPAFHQGGSVLKLRVCGKTGTAQVENERGQKTGWNYWFASFAPYENPQYAVVVMVQSESSGSGGSVCAPIAHDIYAEILKKENSTAPRNLAEAN
jgi:penicillin-binding protein 2